MHTRLSRHKNSTERMRFGDVSMAYEVQYYKLKSKWNEILSLVRITKGEALKTKGLKRPGGWGGSNIFEVLRLVFDYPLALLLHLFSHSETIETNMHGQNEDGEPTQRTKCHVVGRVGLSNTGNVVTWTYA